MKRICYFECFSGASGDMILAALLGTGINKKQFLTELDKIKDIKGYFEIKISDVVKKGISAVDADVILTHHEHHHRGLNDIVKIINSSDIDSKVKNLAIKIFTTLAKAEAKVHNQDINTVHFHEVGAIDAIVDIVGFSILFTSLNIDKVIISPVNAGSGFVNADHGVLPVPAPATLEILKESIWPVNNSIKIEGETLTPTGAAILATIKDEFGSFPKFDQITSVSYGAGKKNFENIANVIRLTLGNTYESNHIDNDSVYVLETNIDDMQPEFYDYIMSRLFDNGALDVYLTPIIMKKSRPACKISVICNEKNKSLMEKIIFDETSTIGIRSYKTQRSILKKEFVKVNLEGLGEISVKIAKDNDGKILSVKPEYEDCAKLAILNNMPIKNIYDFALKNFDSNK
ncbi:MAG: nickel pincer cofactor biosynthesis protein LarC [Candidatus Gastranaerophilales bacterium]|nr:nickel pincer cofactor biosynthesis protein LarC [Candidatus Gastranaerophilales bacterium]